MFRSPRIASLAASVTLTLGVSALAMAATPEAPVTDLSAYLGEGASPATRQSFAENVVLGYYSATRGARPALGQFISSAGGAPVDLRPDNRVAFELGRELAQGQVQLRPEEATALAELVGQTVAPGGRFEGIPAGAPTGTPASGGGGTVESTTQPLSSPAGGATDQPNRDEQTPSPVGNPPTNQGTPGTPTPTDSDGDGIPDSQDPYPNNPYPQAPGSDPLSQITQAIQQGAQTLKDLLGNKGGGGGGGNCGGGGGGGQPGGGQPGQAGQGQAPGAQGQQAQNPQGQNPQGQNPQGQDQQAQSGKQAEQGQTDQQQQQQQEPGQLASTLANAGANLKQQLAKAADEQKNNAAKARAAATGACAEAASYLHNQGSSYYVPGYAQALEKACKDKLAKAREEDLLAKAYDDALNGWDDWWKKLLNGFDPNELQAFADALNCGLNGGDCWEKYLRSRGFLPAIPTGQPPPPETATPVPVKVTTAAR